MSKFRRVRSVLFGAFLLLCAFVFVLIPEDSYYIVAAILCISLLVYGFRMLLFYFRMARHMVGGKAILYQAVIILDAGLFTSSVITMSSFIILFYLMAIFVFSGAIDILRSMEMRRVGGSWRFKFISGIVNVLFALTMLIVGVFIGDLHILIYGYCISLAYTAVIRIVTAFRKTAVVYIG